MITLLTDPHKWDQAVELSYYPYISYKYGWLHAVGSYFSHLKPLPFAKLDEEGKVEYVCPCWHDSQKAQIISSPLVVPGFINQNREPQEMVEALLDYARKEKCRRIHLQIPPGYNYADVLLAMGFRLVRKVCFYNIDIKGLQSLEEYLEKRCTKNRKYDIRYALKQGLQIDILEPSPQALDRFYVFYKELGRRRGFETFDKSFIESISRSLHPFARIWVVSVEGVDVGSAFTFEFKGRLWGWLLQSGQEFRKFKPDSFLFAANIRYGIKKGMHVIDMGTSPLESPLGKFKQRFGAYPVFNEVYELDLSLFGLFNRAFVDLKTIVKNRWLHGKNNKIFST